MSEQGVNRFLEGLKALEREGSLDAIVAAFAPDAVVGNVMTTGTQQGTNDVRRFWQTYRDSFKQVSSTFRNVIRKGERAALEWHTEGTNLRGAPFAYQGVSILELDAEDRVRRFWAYFDPGRLTEHVGEARLGGVAFAPASEDLVRETP